MAQMIIYNGELIRICPKNSNKLEYSKNDGRTWITRFSGPFYGTFMELTDNGKELLANTSKGLFYSKNNGRTWIKRS